jgi:hypothetical protein
MLWPGLGRFTSTHHFHQMSSALHWFLALASVLVMALVGLEAARRLLLNRPPAAMAGRLTAIILLMLGVTAASGLGMLVAGAHPREQLHLMYALFAFGPIPVATALGIRGSPRRRALTTLVGAIFGLVVMMRLFMTG